jgi:hypothetical protein
MNANKIWMKLLMSSMLLALLFTAACGMKNDIKGPAEQALAEQGNAIMTCLQGGEFQAVYDMLSLDAQQAWDKAIRTRWVSSTVYLESLVMQDASLIAVWNFDSARVFTENGTLRGALDGRVDYVDGKSGELRLELEQENGTWKLRSFSLEQ